MSWINTGVCENLFLVSLDLVSLRFHFWFCCLSVFAELFLEAAELHSGNQSQQWSMKNKL